MHSAAAQQVQQDRLRLILLVVSGDHRCRAMLVSRLAKQRVARPPRRLLYADSGKNLPWGKGHRDDGKGHLQRLGQCPSARCIRPGGRAQAMVHVDEVRVHVKSGSYVPQGDRQGK